MDTHKDSAEGGGSPTSALSYLVKEPKPVPDSVRIAKKYAGLSIVRKLLLAGGAQPKDVRQIDPKAIKMKGYLFKKGVLGYDVRWFSLSGEDALLTYYTHENDQSPKAAIPLFKFQVYGYEEYKNRRSGPLGRSGSSREDEDDDGGDGKEISVSRGRTTPRNSFVSRLGAGGASQGDSDDDSMGPGHRTRSAPLQRLPSRASSSFLSLVDFHSPVVGKDQQQQQQQQQQQHPNTISQTDLFPAAFAGLPGIPSIPGMQSIPGISSIQGIPSFPGFQSIPAKLKFLNKLQMNKLPDHLKFVVVTPSRTYKFAAPSEEEYEMWVQSLQQLSEYKAAEEFSKRRMLVSTFDDLLQSTKAPPPPTGVTLKSAHVCANCKKKFNFTRPRAQCAQCGYHFCANDLRCLSPEDSETKERHCASCLQIRTHAQLRFHAAAANISLEIVEARDLMASDANGFSDPYCVAYFEGQEFRTPIIDKSLNPKWNAMFIIPWIGISKSIAIGVFDFDRYSYDDFLGMVFIPLSELEPDTLYEDWFPLVGRPGKVSDQHAGITGHLKLRIVISPNLLATITTSVWDGVKPRPDDPFSLGQITNQVKRFVGLLQSFQIGWFASTAGATLRYEHPFRLVCSVVLLLWAAAKFPAEYVLPLLVFMLLMKLIANFIEARLNEVWYGGVRIKTSVLQKFRSSRKNNEDDSEDDDDVNEGGTFADKRDLMPASRHGFEENPEVEKDEDFDKDAPPPPPPPQGVPAAMQEDEPDEEEEDSNVNIFQRYRQVKGTLAGLQNSLRSVSDQLERIQNAFSWRNPSLSFMLMILLIVLIFILLHVPFRLLIALLTLHFSTKRLRVLKKMDPPVNEEDNFLERIPTEYDLFANSVSVPKALLKA